MDGILRNLLYQIGSLDQKHALHVIHGSEKTTTTLTNRRKKDTIHKQNKNMCSGTYRNCSLPNPLKTPGVIFLILLLDKDLKTIELENG